MHQSYLVTNNNRDQTVLSEAPQESILIVKLPALHNYMIVKNDESLVSF